MVVVQFGFDPDKEYEVLHTFQLRLNDVGSN